MAQNSGGNYTYKYNLSDRNVRYTFDIYNGAVRSLQQDDYYAFGLRKSGSPVGLDNKYLYNGKEMQDELDGQYDYGARFYDPIIGKWNVVDKKAEFYFSHSSYVYALNTPTNVVDPDGNLVIFINGQHTGDGSSGYKTGSNWRGTNDYWRNEKRGDFDMKVMDRLGDHNAIYRDGSMRGFLNTSTGGGSIFGMWGTIFGSSNLNVNNRLEGGYLQGLEDAKMIIENLARDKQGNIVETIKVISHSMGGAYGKGYVKAILEYAKNNNVAGVKVAFEADFAPFQPDDQKAIDDVPTFQFSHKKDMIAGEEQMPGAKKMNTSSDKRQGHSIFSFFRQIINLPAGHYKVVNGKILPAINTLKR